MMASSQLALRRKAVWGPKRHLIATLFILAATAPQALAASRHAQSGHRAQPGVPHTSRVEKLDKELTARATRNPSNMTRVIVTLQPGAELPPEFARLANRHGKLRIINGDVVDLPNRVIKALSDHPSVFNVRYDRPIARFNYRTSLTVGTRAVQQMLGVTGAGIGVAVVDSGIAMWHDDLTNRSNTLFPFGDQRVAGFVDFVNGQLTPYDDNGHGTHVAGIIAGNGFDSDGQKAGAAPGASLVSLKVLDANGPGGSARSSPRSTGCWRITRPITSASSTCRWGRPSTSRSQ